jgi:hypothetical protein
MHHPEPGLSEAVDNSTKNVSDKQAAEIRFTTKSLDRVAITVKQYETDQTEPHPAQLKVNLNVPVVSLVDREIRE